MEKCERLEQLMKRDLERQLDFQTKTVARDLLSAENEKTDYFENSFKEKKSEILSAIESSGELPQKELAEHFNKIFKEILSLQKYVASSNLFLRTYDIKIYQESIRDLSSKVKELELELLPKKKFGFRTKVAANKVNGKAPVAANLNGSAAPKFIPVDENFCGFKDEENKTLSLEGEIIFKKDVTLTNLADCTIQIFGSPSTLHMSNLKRCKVLSGPVSTSIFADACLDCTLVISCQQLRLHSSKNIHIYLHVTSRAIMEDCDKIYTAPYNLSYSTITDDYEKSGLDRNINNWVSFDDFNWLNVEKHSPHWSVLDENKRVAEWNVLTE